MNRDRQHACSIYSSIFFGFIYMDSNALTNWNYKLVLGGSKKKKLVLEFYIYFRHISID